MRQSGLVILGVFLAITLGACEQSPPASAPSGSGAATQSAAPAPAAPATTAPSGAMETVKRKAQEGADVAAGIIRQIREKYDENAKRELARMDAYIDELKARLATAKEDARPALEKQIQEWTARAQQARDTLGKLAGASDDVWQEMKKGVDGALNEFKQALASQPASQPTTAPGGA